MQRGGQQALIVVGLVVLGFLLGAAIGMLGVEEPWTYVIMGVFVVIVLPPVIRYRSRPRS